MKIGTIATLLALTACGKNTGAMGFGGGGEPQGLPDQTATDTGMADDTGGGNTGAPVGDPPEIVSAGGSWNSDNLLIDIIATDPDNDIDNGQVGLTIDDLDEQWFAIQDSETATGTIEAAYYRERDEISVTLEDIGTDGPVPVIMVRVKDSQMNPSGSLAVEIASP